MPNETEQIRVDIILNTRAALEELAAMSESADNFEQRITRFGNYLINSSKKWGVPIQQLRRDFIALDAEMKALGEKGGLPQGIFPGQNVNEIFKWTDDYIKASAAANNFRTNQEGVVTSIQHVTTAAQKMNVEIVKLQKPARNNLGQFMGGSDFEKQFSQASTYAQKISLVQGTIQNLASTTGSSFKDSAAALTKGFPQLLKDTNLTTVAVENLTKANIGLSASFRSEAEVVQVLQQKLSGLQAQGKLNLTGSRNDQVEQLKNVIRGLAKDTGAQYGQIGKQLSEIGVPAAQVNAAVKGLNTELTNGTRAAQGFTHSIDVIRTALGTLTAIGIFQIINFITQSFTEATKAARELEDSLFRLSNVEKILSENGAEVSMKGLKDGIKDIKKLLPIFSKEDITQLVAQVSISTKELGFTEQQILDLSKAIGVLNVRSTEEETASATAQKVISSLITDNAKGISGLGLSFKEGAIQAKAMEMQLLQAGESVNDLTDKEKAQVKYQILLQNTNDELANMGDYLDSNTARMKINSAAWHDMLTTWGQLFIAFTPATTKLSEFLTAAGNMLKIYATIATTGITFIKEFVGAITSSKKTIEDAGNAAKEAGKKMLLSLFPEGAEFAKGSILDKMFGDAFKDQVKETPTAPHTGASEEEKKEGDKLVKATAETEEKISAIMQEARDKREDIERDYRRKIEDANRDHQQKLQDIALDVQRKQADATRNYNQKVEDINRDTNEKIAEAQADQRQKDLDAEAEYQRKLRELREKFLFDLEDALRERDARQVLRLIREYQMDKKNLAEKRKNDRQEAKKDLAEKLADIERERQLKLEAAARELAEKQAEIKLWEERERADAALALQRKLEDARRWHQRELQEYQQYLQRKLQELAKAIAKEYQLTAAGSDAIYRLINSYYGTSGSISALLQKGLSTQLNSIVSSTSSSGSGGSIVSPTWAQAGFYGAAEGGTFVATRPTKVMFGEKGPEMASFTPLGRTGADVGKVFGDTKTGGAQNSLSMRISLSNGLVAEIVDTSLESVAAVIDKIGREKS